MEGEGKPQQGVVSSAQMTQAILIGGPTASGKSTLAIAVARAFDGVIVNADSMQIYRPMAILTARPGAADLATAPHQLYGVLDGDDPCSAGRWLDLARETVADICAAGRLPILVGGTGLYLRAALRGIAPTPRIPDNIRDDAKARLAERGAANFHAALAQRDPDGAARLRPSDRQRMVRAWEIIEATGRTIADWQTEEDTAPVADRCLALTLLPPREAVYTACDARFLAMIEAGAIEEVRALLDLGLDPDLPVMKAVGVPEIAAHLAGEASLEQTIAKSQMATRRYAKRQYTWFKRQIPEAETFETQFSESLTTRIFAKIRQFLLTEAA